MRPTKEGARSDTEGMVVEPEQKPDVASVLLPTKPGSEEEAWELTFRDEFDTPNLDVTKWNTSFWWGRTRDKELAYYTDDAVSVGAGVLTLEATKRSENGYSYVSGVVTTLSKFAQKSGFFEVRAQMPTGKGLWPAVWLMPDAGSSRTVWPPEIDLVESLGDDPGLVYMNVHYTTSRTPHGQIPKEYRGPDLSLGFHVFGIEWTPKAITWYVDGIERHRVQRNVPMTQMYIIANLALGHWAGEPDSSTPFPARFVVDYVRVWQPVEAAISN